jgi:hypothetical protein
VAGQGGGGPAGGGGAAGACVVSTNKLQVAPPAVSFVLDHSGSMSDKYPGDAQNKWRTLVAALAPGAQKLDSRVTASVGFFPAGKFDAGVCSVFGGVGENCDAILVDGGCQDVDQTPLVPFAPAPAAFATAQTSLANLPPGGISPTRWALRYASAYARGANVTGERYLVLATDGMPELSTASTPPKEPRSKECGSLTDVLAEPSLAADGNPAVRTFVVGVAGSATPSFLGELAVRGGTAPKGCDPDTDGPTACYYRLPGNTLASAAAKAFEDIGERIASGCIWEVPNAPALDSALVLRAAGKDGTLQTIPYDASHAEGWAFVDAGRTRVRIFGQSCESFHNGEWKTVEAESTTCSAP